MGVGNLFNWPDKRGESNPFPHIFPLFTGEPETKAVRAKVYTVKKGLAIFLSPTGMSLTKLYLAGNNSPSPRKVWSKTIQESRKNMFYSVSQQRFASGLKTFSEHDIVNRSCEGVSRSRRA